MATAQYKGLDSIDIADIEAVGVNSDVAAEFHEKLNKIVDHDGPATPQTWHRVSKDLLTPDLPFSLHQMMYYGCYKDFGLDPPAWLPDPGSAKSSNVGQLLERCGEEFLGSKYKDPISSFSDFQEFSVSNPEVYWKAVFEEMNVSFSVPPQCILCEDPSHPGGKWLPGARLNPAKHCLSLNGKRTSNDIALIWRNEGEDEAPLGKMTLEELRSEVCRVVDAESPMAIVIPNRASSLSIKLRDGDIAWHDFLERVKESKELKFDAVELPTDAFTNILFSSGTTGEPKAIPWSVITPLKAAADGWCHMDIQKGDVVAWPTNLGWMMGPWLVYASLLNGASMALYNGSPLGSGFAKFVQDANVTMLGVIPSIVRTWKTTNCTSGFDWSTIRCFGSTGEASSVDEYLWLMGRAQYKPVIEYCGGTEIGGGFVTGSLLQPQSLAAFSTAAMGCSLFIIDKDGSPIPPGVPGIGELALGPFIFGSSSTLLNADHYKVYFKGMPTWNGKVLRRHGDVIEYTCRGYYRAQGRADDTMNLGGIKVSSLEIERICNAVDDDILETAAIGVPPAGGGPEKLVIVVVFKDANEPNHSLNKLMIAFNSALQKKLNPLFKVSNIVALPSLPRTATNKVMRRVLRQQFTEANNGL
nr:probable acyl-activating enzyme 17, peroxisomal [Ipomoea batatas]